jgi:hypothetical protein
MGIALEEADNLLLICQEAPRASGADLLVNT